MFTATARSDTGMFTVTYTTALPSNAYLVSGMAIRNHASLNRELLFEMQSATSLNNVKSTTVVKVMTRSDGGTAEDPLQAWFYCFGG